MSSEPSRLVEILMRRVTDLEDQLSRQEEMQQADYLEQTTDRLRELANLYLAEPHDFTSGQFVRWKPGLKNRRRPDYNEPAVVIDVLDEPIIDREETPSSQYFGERLDIELGILDRENELATYYYDRRRFEPIES